MDSNTQQALNDAKSTWSFILLLRRALVADLLPRALPIPLDLRSYLRFCPPLLYLNLGVGSFLGVVLKPMRYVRFLQTTLIILHS